MRIMLVISSLQRGGAERVASIMANHWAESGHPVSLVTIQGKHQDAYALHPEITRVALNLGRVSRNPAGGLWNNLRRIRGLRAAVRRLRPDVVISLVTHTNLLVLIATLRMDVPVVVSERVNPLQMRIGAVRRVLRAWLYPRAAALVVQTDAVRKAMRHLLPPGNITVIPNPVPADDPDELQAHVSLREQLRLPAGAKVIAAMGRLEPQKGFDLLVDAFAMLHGRHPDWQLVIFGEGLARAPLEAQITRLGLTACAHLPGVVRTARKYLAEADLFVLSSRFEGFPNVLLEAMACGCAVVSFDCPSGPGEIIRNDQDGLLVEAGKVTAFAEALSALMDSPARREALGKNARQVLERFSADRIMSLWDGLLSETCRSGDIRRDVERFS